MGSRDNFVQIFNDLFAKKGCTQEELAAYVGQSRQAVGKWTCGNSKRTLYHIGDYFILRIAA